MSIIFKRIDNPYSHDLFAMTKAGLFPFVNEVYGWDDEFQQQRMRDDYRAKWFYWIVSEGEQIGYVCFKSYEQTLHLHLVIIAEPFQGKGYGKLTMRAIHDIARSELRDVTLSCFKCNRRAVELYQSLNYEIIEEEEHFLVLRLSHHNNRLSSGA